MIGCKQFVKHDPTTDEYYFNGKWYDHYPAEEVEDYQSRYDEAQERKWEERRQQ